MKNPFKYFSKQTCSYDRLTELSVWGYTLLKIARQNNRTVIFYISFWLISYFISGQMQQLALIAYGNYSAFAALRWHLPISKSFDGKRLYARRLFLHLRINNWIISFEDSPVRTYDHFCPPRYVWNLQALYCHGWKEIRRALKFREPVYGIIHRRDNVDLVDWSQADWFKNYYQMKKYIYRENDDVEVTASFQELDYHDYLQAAHEGTKTRDHIMEAHENGNGNLVIIP